MEQFRGAAAHLVRDSEGKAWSDEPREQSTYAKVHKFWGSLYVSFVYANRTKVPVSQRNLRKLNIDTYGAGVQTCKLFIR